MVFNAMRAVLKGGRYIDDAFAGVPKLGELSLLDRSIDSDRLIETANNMIDGSIKSGLENISPEATILLENQQTGDMIKGYKREFERIIGGESGMRWLASKMPARFEKELQGVIGEFGARIEDDVAKLVNQPMPKESTTKQYLNYLYGNPTKTAGHLSAKKTGFVGNVFTENLDTLNNTLRELTADAIGKSKRFKSWEDFQRKNMNYSILDKLTDYAEATFNNPAANYDKFKEFTQNYSIVLTRGEKLRPEFLPMMMKVSEKVEKTLGDMFRFEFDYHYYDPKTTDKYRIGLKPSEQNNTGISSTMRDTGVAMSDTITNRRYQEAVAQGMDMTDNRNIEFTINKIPNLSKQSRLERLINKFNATEDVDMSNEYKLGIELFDESQKKELENFFISEGLQDNINVKNAFDTLDLNAMVSSNSMSPQSLGLMIAEMEKANAAITRASTTGKKIMYADPEIPSNYTQNVNSISRDIKRVPYTSIKETSDGIPIIDIDTFDLMDKHTKMSGSIMINPIRRAKDGSLVRDLFSKNINIGNFQESISKGDVAGQDKLKRVLFDAAETQDQAPVTTLLERAMKRPDRITEQLSMASLTIKGLTDNFDLLMKAVPSGTTQKQVITELNQYVSKIQDRFRKATKIPDAKLGFNFKEFRFDEQGEMIGRPVLQLEHTPVRRMRPIDVDKLKNQIFGITPPLGIGIELKLKEDKSK